MFTHSHLWPLSLKVWKKIINRIELRALKIFDFRNKWLNQLEFIGSDGPPINGIKYLMTKIRLWLKHCDIQRRFIRIMLYPENFIDFELKVPANPFAQAFGAGGFKNSFSGLGGYNSIRLENPHIRVVYGEIEQSQSPWTGPVTFSVWRFIFSPLQTVCPIEKNQIFKPLIDRRLFIVTETERFKF